MVIQVKINKIRKMTTEEMNNKIVEIKAELLDLRMKQATGNLEKPHKVNELRKTIARIKTVLNEKDGSEI